MPIVHPEKIWKKELALEYTGEEATEDRLERVNILRKTICQLRDLTVELAKERHHLRRGKRALTADKLVQEVLARYRERFNEIDVQRYFGISI